MHSVFLQKYLTAKRSLKKQHHTFTFQASAYHRIIQKIIDKWSQFSRERAPTSTTQATLMTSLLALLLLSQ